MERGQADPISKLISQPNQHENLSYSMVDQVKKIALEYCQAADPTSIIEHEIETKKWLEECDFINNLATAEPRDSIVSLSILWSIPGIASLVHWDHVNGLYANIRRETDRFIEAYRQASHEESIMMASCFSDLLAHAHGAVHMGPLLEITLACQTFSNKPVLAHKILEQGCDTTHVDSWAEDAGYHSQTRLWRLYDAPDAKNEGIQHIAKDGLALTDANTVIIDIATLSNSPQQPTRKQLEQNPKSTDLRFLLDYYSADQKTRRDYDPEDVHDVYELGVDPYLSDEDRRLFVRYRQNVESYPLLARLIERLIQQANYTRVQFQPLFNSPTISSFEDLRERIAFSQVHRARVRMPVEEDLGLHFTDLRLREQRSLLVYISHCLRPEYTKTCSVIKQYGVNAARTFLALETDATHGERILAFANNAEPAVAKQVFEAFARIADKIDLSAQELAQQLYQQDKTQPMDAEQVRQELIKRGGRILLEAETALKQDPTGETLLHALKKYEADTVLFCVLAKQAQTENGRHLSLEQLKRLTLRSFRPDELKPQEKQQALESYVKIAETNWCTKGKYTMDTVLEGITHGFEHQDTEFFELRFDNEVAAFLRLEKMPSTENDYYIGSYNLHPKLHDSRLGQTFYYQVVAAFMERHPHAVLHAHALATDPIVQRYVMDFGFRIRGIERDKQPDGTVTPWYQITIEPKNTSARSPSSYTAHQGSLHHPSSLFQWIEEQTRSGGIVDSYTVDKKTGAIHVRAQSKKPQTTDLQTSHAA